jgi:secondary thiamine-phosphate synthase enzyme
MIKYLEIKTRAKTELVDVTPEIKELLRKTSINNGVCHLFVMHTTAGITVNEGADPAVQRDMNSFFSKLVPNDPYFTHAEGNSDAHIKSSMVGISLTLLVEGGRPLLGTWQSVYLCEFDGPRPRKIAVKIVPDE